MGPRDEPRHALLKSLGCPVKKRLLCACKRSLLLIANVPKAAVELCNLLPVPHLLPLLLLDLLG